MVYTARSITCTLCIADWIVAGRGCVQQTQGHSSMSVAREGITASNHRRAPVREQQQRCTKSDVCGEAQRLVRLGQDIGAGFTWQDDCGGVWLCSRFQLLTDCSNAPTSRYTTTNQKCTTLNQQAAGMALLFPQNCTYHKCCLFCCHALFCLFMLGACCLHV